MRRADISTPLPTLAPGEPGCPDLGGLGPSLRLALLSATLGPSLRRAGIRWYGPDKRGTIKRVTLQGLARRGLLFFPDPNTARATRRGHWCARTLRTEIAGLSYCVEINGISNFIMGENECHTVA
jgi:hypothetical protein